MPQFIMLEDYGAVGNGATDDTAAVNAAVVAATGTGPTIRLKAGAIYKVTDELDLAGVKIIGEGAAQFVQHGTNKGLFNVADDCILQGFDIEYRPAGVVHARPAPTGVWADGLSSFQKISGFFVKGSRNLIKDIRSENFFTAVCLRGPVEQVPVAISAIARGTTTLVTMPGHNLVAGNRGIFDNVGGTTQLNGVYASVASVARR